MGRRFTYDVNTSMAGTTRIRRLTVIKRQHEGNPPRPGSMAQFTRLCAQWMDGAFADGYGRVMAVGAGFA